MGIDELYTRLNNKWGCALRCSYACIKIGEANSFTYTGMLPVSPINKIIKDNKMIKKLFVKGFQRVKSISIDINGNPITFIQGDNEAGKTSFLNAIKDLFAKGQKFTSRINNESDSAIIECITDECHIVQETMKAGTALNIKIFDTDKTLKGQKARDYLFEKVEILATNPLAILGTNTFEKITTMLLGSERALEYKEERKDLYEMRTTQNRSLKEKETLTKFPPEKALETDVPNSKELSEKLNKLLRIKTSLDRVPIEIATADTNITNALQTIKNAEESIVKAKEEINRWKEHKEKIEIWKEKNKKVPDQINVLNTQLENISEITNKATKYSEYLKNLEQLKKVRKGSEDLTNQIKTCDEAITKEIMNAGLPKGFSVVDGDFVDQNNMPIDNWSNSEKTKFCYELIFNSIKTKDIKFLLLEDAHDLDDNKIKVLSDWAKETGVTILAETVRKIEGGQTIKIVEGENFNE